MLQGKKILLGVSGSIAAYKSALLVRLLVKAGAQVKVIMTSSAAEFITPLTLSTLSKNPVFQHFVKNEQGEWNNHVELGLWADLFVLAPASANTIAKMANGLCDNLLLATYLSARCKVLIAPAMDLDMYAHLATQRNLETLQHDGVDVLKSPHGELASGLSGTGRMAEPEDILEFIFDFFGANHKDALEGKKAIVTAGPTYESIDPVRFIGNHSSGKMGYAIAEALAKAGASVVLVSGPTDCGVKNKNIRVYKVQSAGEMNAVCTRLYPTADIAVLAAAVADYTPENVATQKIKKTGDHLNLKLIKTEDIASNLGKLKKGHQFNVGFALETEDEVSNAREKIAKKNFDLIVINTLKDAGAGFGHDTNKISILDKDNNLQKFELKNKKEVARDIVDAIIGKIS